MIHLITGKPGSTKTFLAAALMSKLCDEEPAKAAAEKEKHDRIEEKIGKIRAGIQYQLNDAGVYVPETKDGWKLGRDADILEAGVTRYEARTVTTDLQLKGEFAKRVTLISSLSELAAIKNTYLFLDEAQLYLNARTWSAVPIEIQFLLQQHRKRNIEIFFIVQNARRMDVICRELVGRYWECDRPFRYRKLWRLLKLNRLGTVTEYEPESVMWSQGDDTAAATKEEKIMKKNYVWLQGDPLEDEVDLGGRFFGEFGLFGFRSRRSEDAWLSYHTRQEIALPTDSRFKGSDTVADVTARSNRKP